MAAGSVRTPRSRTKWPSKRACVPYERGCGLPRLVGPEVASALASDLTSTHDAPMISRTSVSLDLRANSRAHLAAGEPFEHCRDPAFDDPAGQEVAQRIGGGVVRVRVAVHGPPATTGRGDLLEHAAGAAPVVDTGELEVGDLHVNAGRLRDGDRFADGLAAVVGLVANVRRVRGAVAAEHARQRQDLGAVGMAAGSGEE